MTFFLTFGANDNFFHLAEKSIFHREPDFVNLALFVLVEKWDFFKKLNCNPKMAANNKLP